MVESGKTTLSSQFVQIPDTPTNFHRPSTSRSTEITKALDPPPQIPQREWILPGYVNYVSKTFAYSTHEVSFRSPHSKRFPRFPVSPSDTPTPQCHQIWSGFKIRALRHEFLLNIKFNKSSYVTCDEVGRTKSQEHIW